MIAELRIDDKVALKDAKMRLEKLEKQFLDIY